MEKVRARVIIEGSVQGVFFRHHTQEMAFRLGVKGWVKTAGMAVLKLSLKAIRNGGADHPVVSSGSI